MERPAPSTPWWARFEHTGERTGPVCSIRTFEAVECVVEHDAEGVPHRKCHRIMRKFRECPGRPAEEIETSVSSSDVAEGDADPLGSALSRLPGGGDALQAEVGEALEEFFRMAEELQQQIVADCDDAAAPEQQPQKEQRARGSGDGGLLGRLFRRNQGRAEGGSGAGARAADPRLWEELKKNIEEV